MKKVITIAALASVALSSDFLSHHKPTLIKDGANIVKDIKTHSVGKLIKDGVKISKELKLEDQFFLVTNEVEGALRDTREMLAQAEILLQQMEEQLPMFKTAYPAMYEKMLEEYNTQKQNLAQARKDLDFAEAMYRATAQSQSTGGALQFQPMRRLQAEDNEFFSQSEAEASMREMIALAQKVAQNQGDLESQVKDMRAMVTLADKLLKGLEEELPVIQRNNPALYEQVSEQYKYQKQMMAQAKKQLEALEKEAQTKAKAVGSVIKFQTKRMLLADDNEFFAADEVEVLLKESRESLDQAEEACRELDEILPRIKDNYPQEYAKMYEENVARKLSIAQMRKELVELEKTVAQQNAEFVALNIQARRRLQASDNEFYAIDEVEGQVKEMKEMLAFAEKLLKDMEEELPVIQRNMPAVYEQMLAQFLLQKEQLEKAKREVENLESLIQFQPAQNTIKFQPMRRRLEADDELFNLGELLKEGKKIRDEIKRH